MPDYQRDVDQFHKKFNIPRSKNVKLPSADYLEFRWKLLQDETDEVFNAMQTRDPVKIARELVDVIYIAIGTLVACGIPLIPVWRAVHRANMRKVLDADRGKPVKPIGWESPDITIAKALGRKTPGFLSRKT